MCLEVSSLPKKQTVSICLCFIHYIFQILCRPSDSTIADFQMGVYVRLDVPTFQQILTALSTNLTSAPIYVDTKSQ